jgi:hypothetical protein
VDEWYYYDGNEYLDIPYRLILARQDLPLELEFEAYRDGVYEACVRALEELDREGLFGSGAERDETLVLFEAGDSQEFPEAIRRLNTPKMFKRYQAWRRNPD